MSMVADTSVPVSARRPRKLPVEASILAVLVGIALIFELLGWTLRGQSFLGNPSRLLIIILQVSIVGLLAVGVTQVIITTGIDLSSGSVLALSAMVAASLAQESDYARAVYPGLGDLPILIPVAAGLLVGALAGLCNGTLVTLGRLPPFIATLGMMVTARGLARYYTHGQPISMLTDKFTAIGGGANPVLIFLVVAAIFHVALRYTRYGKYTYAIGGNMQAARVSGINVTRHLMLVYTIAGGLSGLAGIIMAGARHQRPGRHGHVLRTRRHRGGGDRRHQPVRWHRPHHRHRHRHADPRRDDQRLHFPGRRCLHPGHREGADHHRRRDGRPVQTQAPLDLKSKSMGETIK